MAAPRLLAGRYFRLNRGNGAQPQVFTFLCSVTTVKLDEAVEFDDVMVIDCANPTDIAQRQSVPKGQMWDIAASGKCDHARYQVLRSDFDSKETTTYQILADDDGADGGGSYKGDAFVEKLSLQKTENGIVTFDFNLKGQAGLIWTAAA